MDTEQPTLPPHQRVELHDFVNPRFELRRLFSEALGTYLLLAVAVGGHVVDAATNGGVGSGATATAPGLMVMAVILFMGTISGAHLNPVVTVAFALRRDFPWRRVPAYVVAQVVGAVLGALTVEAMIGTKGSLVATQPGAGFSVLQAFLMEILLTAGLVSVILGAASGGQNVGPLAAIAAGGYIVLAGLWGGPVSGASMNPARSFAPALLGGDLNLFWIYLLGPAIGALIAVGFAVVLRGRHTDAAAARAAQGLP
jgi:aquaporin Z